MELSLSIFFLETAFGGVGREGAGSCENSSGRENNFFLTGVSQLGIRMNWHILVHFGEGCVHFGLMRMAPARKI